MFYVPLLIMMMVPTFLCASDQSHSNTTDLTSDMKEIMAAFQENHKLGSKLVQCTERVRRNDVIESFTNCLAHFCDTIKSNPTSKLSHSDFKELCDNTKNPEQLTHGLLYLFEEGQNLVKLQMERDLALTYAQKTEDLREYEADQYSIGQPSLMGPISGRYRNQVKKIDNAIEEKTAEIRAHLAQICPELVPFVN